MRKKKRKKHTKIITKIVLFSGILIGGGIGIVTIMNCNVPEKRLMEYMKYIEKGEYEQMYAMLDQKKSSMNSKEEFIERNSKIYEGIEMSDLSITDITVKRQRKRKCGSFLYNKYADCCRKCRIYQRCGIFT